MGGRRKLQINASRYENAIAALYFVTNSCFATWLTNRIVGCAEGNTTCLMGWSAFVLRMLNRQRSKFISTMYERVQAMKSLFAIACGFVFLVVITVVTGLCVQPTSALLASPSPSPNEQQPAAQSQDSNQLAELVPVEPEVHDFMEYVFEPVYDRLKKALSEEPNEEAWESITSGSLTLAEGANLVLIRKRDNAPQEWAKHATDVRQAGSEFYDAAKAKDYAGAKRGFQQLLNECNACHDRFAGGRPNLQP